MMPVGAAMPTTPASPLRYRPDIGPVLVVSGADGATRRYRAYDLAEELELAGVMATVAPRIDAALLARSPAWPIVVLHRVAWDPLVQSLIDRTRDAGGVVLFDVDDLVFEPESTHWHHGVQALTPDEKALYHQGVRRYRRTLLACDAALVPTAALAARVRRAGRLAFIRRNAVDLELLGLSIRTAGGRADDAGARPNDAGARWVGDVHRAAAVHRAMHGPTVVVGYASGTRTHDRDFNAACGPALLRVMARRPDVVFHVVGPLALDDDWAAMGERVVRVPAVDWRALPEVIAAFDVNVAPLEVDNLFCQCKSELKWLEAAACAVPTVAVATQAFASALGGALGDEALRDEALRDEALRDEALRDEALRDEALVDEAEGGEGDAAGPAGSTAAAVAGPPTALGLLAEDVDAWEAAIDGLAADPRRRAALGSAAAAWVQAHRTTAAQAERTVATLRAAAATATAGRSKPPVGATDGDVGAPLTIRVLMPEPPPGSGGHTTLMRMVAGLCEAGHDVTVHIERGPLMRDVSEADAARYVRANFPPSAAAVRLGGDLPPADVAIATGWTTAAAVARARGIGTRLYFVQDHEPSFQSLSADYAAAARTYRLGLGHITIGPWLAELIEARFGGRARAVDFGVDHAVYRPGAAPPPARPRVVFYARATTPRRGVALGLAALARVQAERPDVEVVLYGGAPQPGLADFPHVQAGVLDAPALADLYRSATVGLAMSFTNLSLVPLEMMACGLCVVAAASRSTRWFERDGENCVVAAPTVSDLATAILRVIDDAALRDRLVAGGRAAVAAASWDESGRQFAAHVARYAAEDRADRPGGAPAPTGPPPTRIAARHLDGWTVGDGGRADVRTSGIDVREMAWPIAPGRDGLCRVELRFPAVPGRRCDGLVVLRIKALPSAPFDLARADVDTADLVPDGWTAFPFTPLADVAGRTLWAVLSYLPRTDDRPAGTADDALAVELACEVVGGAGIDRVVVGGAGVGGSGVGGASIDRSGADVADFADVADVADVAGVPPSQLPVRPASSIAHLPLPAHRTFALDGAHDPASADPFAFTRLAARRRAALELRRAAGWRERHAAVRRPLAAWARLAAPLPPVPLRPWPADAPARVKLLEGLRRYGPIAVAREAAALWRHRRAAGR
ncbi:MAG: glycosyltransferase [Ardenticatenales bacterium]|nr:glycosyltransferase [Ardenticatenales bacterium]